MPYAQLMGLITPFPVSTKTKTIPAGFYIPAFRVYAYPDRTQDGLIVLPFPNMESDQVEHFLLYEPHTPGNSPVWSNNRFTGASMVIPRQPALYAFHFPNGETYVAISQLMKATLRHWLDSREILSAPPPALEQARHFCGGSLPPELKRRVDALISMPTYHA